MDCIREAADSRYIEKVLYIHTYCTIMNFLVGSEVVVTRVTNR